MSSELSLRRRIVFTGVLAAFVLLAVEATCQLAYRLTAGDFLFNRTGAPLFEADPTRCYRMKPKLAYAHKTNEFATVIYTNSEGMRTGPDQREVTFEKPPGVYRILFLGPSFTFGWGNDYEQSYPTLIGDGLAAQGKRVEIINLGTPAQGIEPQLCWLEKVGYRYQPDLVVQTLYGQRVETVVGECPQPLTCPVIADSTLYSEAPTLERRLIASLKNLGIVFYGYYVYQWALGGAPLHETGTGKELHQPHAVEGVDGESLANDFARYEGLVDRVLGERTPVVFLFIPMSFVVHPDDAARWSHLLVADPLGSRARIQSDIEALRARGHVMIDATPALVERAERERLYYWLDIHMNPAGNRVVADAALPVLVDQISATASGGH